MTTRESTVRDKTQAARRDSPLAEAFERIRALRGWRRRTVAFAAGIGAALAQAPFYLLPLMAIAYSALVLLVDGADDAPRPVRAGFAAGWFFAFGYFLVGLYWVAYSFLVQAEVFAWMAPFAVIGLPAFLALFIGAATAAAVKFSRRGWRRIFSLAALLSVAEYARGHLFTGLPWNLPGQAFAGTAMGAQTAAFWGAYGLSLVALTIAMAPVAFAGRSRGLLKGACAALAATALLFAVGAARLALAPKETRAGVFVRIVQPNIPQREKIDGDYWRRNFERHVALSAAPGPSGRLYVLWPENAVPVLDEATEALNVLDEKLAEDAVIVAGAVRRSSIGDRTHYFNSISVLASTERGFRPVAHYDKHHLVPFGEYLPLEGLLRALGLAQLAPYDDGFTAGNGPMTIRVGGTSFAPLVCYEAIFPGEIYPKGNRPDWIATVTNDSWFGDSSGPRQHFDQARLRAVENGLPMARSANSGVSGLIDGAGRVVARIPLYEQGVIDAALPAALPPTLYARFGDLGFLLLLAGAVFLGFFPARTSR